MTDLAKTHPELSALLEKAKKHVMPPAEIAAQRRSFVRGMCPSDRDYAEWCEYVDKVLKDDPLTMMVAENEHLRARLAKYEGKLTAEEMRERCVDFLNSTADCHDLRGPVSWEFATLLRGLVKFVADLPTEKEEG